MKSKHEFDDDKLEYLGKKGYMGVCKLCGKKVLLRRFHPVQPRTLPHMSKKERRALRKENN